MLQEEADVDSSYRATYGTFRWTRPPSVEVSAPLVQRAEQLEAMLNAAAESDGLVRAKFGEWEEAIGVLDRGQVSPSARAFGSFSASRPSLTLRSNGFAQPVGPRSGHPGQRRRQLVLVLPLARATARHPRPARLPRRPDRATHGPRPARRGRAGSVGAGFDPPAARGGRGGSGWSATRGRRGRGRGRGGGGGSAGGDVDGGAGEARRAVRAGVEAEPGEAGRFAGPDQGRSLPPPALGMEVSKYVGS